MKKSLISFTETFVAGILLALLVMVLIGQSLEITGNSMLPTFKDKERIVVEKVTYKSRPPKRGEIVIFRSLQSDSAFLIKRVVAVPGDTLDLIDMKVTDWGVLEQYRTSPVPAGHFVVLGDNRNESYDSRMFGLIPLDRFVGKAFMVYWPLGSIRKI